MAELSWSDRPEPPEPEAADIAVPASPEQAESWARYEASARMWEGQGLDRDSAAAPGHSEDVAARASGAAMMQQYRRAARHLALARAELTLAVTRLGGYGEDAKAIERTIAEIERVYRAAAARGGVRQ